MKALPVGRAEAGHVVMVNGTALPGSGACPGDACATPLATTVTAASAAVKPAAARILSLDMVS